MSGGSLTEISKLWSKRYSEDFCRYTLYKVAKGLQRMHSKQVLHRDIKGDNVLCNDKGEIKIADLGLSVFLSNEQEYRTTRGGTPNWVSPEIVTGVKYTKPIDIWAFGGFAYELAQGKPLWHQHMSSRREMFNAIKND